MAWTAPKTWTVGETLTAADMNTHMKDNQNWLANDRPRCSAVRSTTQNISDNTSTALSMTDADEYDVGAMHSTGTNPSRITVPSGGAGIYTVKAWWSWGNSGPGRRVITFGKNGAGGFTGKGDMRATDSSGNSAGMASFDVALVAADYIEMFCYQNSGGVVGIVGGLQLMWMAF